MARRRLGPPLGAETDPNMGPNTGANKAGAAPEVKSATGSSQGSATGSGPGSRPPIAQVAGQSAEGAALRKLADDVAAARSDGRMVVEVALADISAEHLMRDRVALAPEGLQALTASIAAHGQRTPVELTPLPASDTSGARYGLISGWRRYHAVKALAATGEHPGTLRALVRPSDSAAEAYVAKVEENEVLEGLSYYERARVVAEATRAGVFADQTDALRALFATASRAKRSKIGSFVEIHEALGDVLRFPAEIPERLGLRLVDALRAGQASALRGALKAAAAGTGPEEIACLTAHVSRAKRATGSDGGKLAKAQSVSHAKHLGETDGEGRILLRPDPIAPESTGERMGPYRLETGIVSGQRALYLTGPLSDERTFARITAAIREITVKQRDGDF